MSLTDPYPIFQASATPVGLYARQKWLGEEKDSRWENDFDAAVQRLLAGQSADGVWNRSVIATVQRLFGLHLTVRNPTDPIDKALDRLLALALKKLSRIRKDFSGQITSQDLDSLPFTPGCSGYFLVSATLFLASIFGREDDSRVLEAYEWLNEEGIKKKGLQASLQNPKQRWNVGPIAKGVEYFSGGSCHEEEAGSLNNDQIPISKFKIRNIRHRAWSLIWHLSIMRGKATAEQDK